MLKMGAGSDTLLLVNKDLLLLEIRLLMEIFNFGTAIVYPRNKGTEKFLGLYSYGSMPFAFVICALMFIRGKEICFISKATKMKGPCFRSLMGQISNYINAGNVAMTFSTSDL